MKKTYYLLVCFMVLSFLNSGCGTVYKVAVDERSVRTQASDEKITLAIRKKIADSDQAKFFDVSTSCYDGDVYLVGEYETLAHKKEAVKLARSVEGVKSVTTYFLKKKKDDFCGSTDNLGLVAKLKAKLIKDTDIWSTNIQIKTVQCHLVLLGFVGSQTEIQKAIEHAKSVPKVRGVKSFLRVAPKQSK